MTTSSTALRKVAEETLQQIDGELQALRDQAKELRETQLKLAIQAARAYDQRKALERRVYALGCFKQQLRLALNQD